MTCTHSTIREAGKGHCVICQGSLPKKATAHTRRVVAAARRELLRQSFVDFVVYYWPVVTGMPFVFNAAIDRIIAALQSVADGTCTRLLLAASPGTGKTTMLAMYSAWRLARDAGHRSIHASHAFELAKTESARVRRLIESDAYRKMFPAVVLREDEATLSHWATTTDGRYFAVGTDGALTGRRAHEAVCDDPLNATDRFSKAARDTLWAWFTESLSTRLDGDRAPIIVCQQRLDRDDLIGRLIAAGGWTLIEVPAELDDGTLMAPNVLPRAKLDELRKQIGAATYACQYMQRPSSDESAAIKRVWWRFHRPSHVPDNAPRPAGCDTEHDAIDTPTKYDRIVIAVDMTFGGTKKANDFCDAAVWGRVGAARFLIERWHKKATQLEQRAAIRDLALKYPYAKVLIEKAAGGAGTIEQLVADGIPNIVPVLTGGRNKAERLSVVSPTIEAGNCYLPLGAAWLGDFVEELAGASTHDDSQDTTSYALAELNAGVDHANRLQMKLDGMQAAFGAMMMPPFLRRPKIDPESVKRNEAARAKAETERLEAETNHKIELDATIEQQRRLQAEAEIRGFVDVQEMAIERSKWAGMDANQRAEHLAKGNDDPTEPLADDEIDAWLAPLTEYELTTPLVEQAQHVRVL